MGFYSDFAGCYEKIFPFRQPTVDFLERWLPSRGPVLDIGCGTGHYCGALARDGRPCLGIDLDEEMVAVARAAYPAGEFRLLDMDRIDALPRGSFAGAFCIGNVLPHLAHDAWPDYLAKVHTLLAPGGVWIWQTVNFDRLLDRDVYDFPPIELAEDDLIFERRYRDITAESLRFQTRLLRSGVEAFAGEVRLFPLTSTDALAGHEASGFELRGHFADFAGTPFVARRSGGSVFVFERNGP